jgi:hypothetical protein
LKWADFQVRNITDLITLRSACFIDKAFSGKKQNFCSWDYSSQVLHCQDFRIDGCQTRGILLHLPVPVKQLWSHMGSALRLIYKWIKITSGTMARRHSYKEYNEHRAMDCGQILEKRKYSFLLL